jgi:Mrp family chromosome partitioning ATPase
LSAKLSGMKDIKHVIAVSSCKGGVGKSTVAVNLAFSLKKLGRNVGIFDADLYGPSLPTMIKPENAHIYQDEEDPNKIMPIEFAGIKAMSYGFAAQNKTAVMRGPMASNLVT